MEEKVDKPPDTTNMDTSGPTLTDDEKQQITKILEQQNPDALAAQVAKIFRQKFQKELEEKTSAEGKFSKYGTYHLVFCYFRARASRSPDVDFYD